MFPSSVINSLRVVSVGMRGISLGNTIVFRGVAVQTRFLRLGNVYAYKRYDACINSSVL